MAARPKQRRLVATLTNRAQQTIGPTATPLDYVIHWITTREFLSELAKDLATEMGESVSRTFLSGVAQRLAPDARALIASARPAAQATAEQSKATGSTEVTAQ